MKSKYLWASIGLLIVGLLGVIYQRQTPTYKSIRQADNAFFWGVYDPNKQAVTIKQFSVESVYFGWDAKSADIEAKIYEIESRQRKVLLTIEPWPTINQNSTKDTLLQEISSGIYDQQIDSVCGALVGSKQKVMVRWGHEMEQTTSRYPWAGATPVNYIQAYRHFVDRCRLKAPNIEFVWSPSGQVGTENYWPGDNYVDLIGLSVYSFDKYDQKYFGHLRSFREVFDGEYHRVKQFNKPVLIDELGVTGTEGYKLDWLKSMKNVLGEYPKLVGIVYFDSADVVGAWENSLETPDWRISPDDFNTLIL